MEDRVMTRNTRKDERGFALVLTVLVVVIVGSIVARDGVVDEHHMIA